MPWRLQEESPDPIMKCIHEKSDMQKGWDLTL